MKNRIVLISLSVLLLSLPWLGFPGYTLWVAFVPLLILQEKLSREKNWKGKPRRFFGYAAVTFLVWNIVTVYWIKNATWIGVVAAFAVNTFISTVSFMVYHYVWRRAPRALAYTVLVSFWIAYEYVYINGEISFPWLILGNGFANTVRAVQWYEYTGILGGSLWVWIVNLLVYEAWRKFRACRCAGAFALPVVIALTPLVVSWAMYARYQEAERPVTVTVVQPNLDPYEEKFVLPQWDQARLILSLAERAPADADYIVTPETSFDYTLWEENLPDNPLIRTLREFMRTHYPGAQLIIGATTFRRYGSKAEASATARTNSNIDFWYDVYNSAIRIDTASVSVYHKSKLVAGAEMIPHYRRFEFLKSLSLELGGVSGMLGVDPERSTFASEDGTQVGVAICYESVYGEYCTEYVGKGAEALFIITNDGWWGDTPGYRQHFSFARLRAIELRRSVARSANTGISGFIGQRGDVLAKTGWDERTALTGTINLNDRLTFYARHGDMIGRICLYTTLLSLLYFIAYRRRKKGYLVD